MLQGLGISHAFVSRLGLIALGALGVCVALSLVFVLFPLLTLDGRESARLRFSMWRRLYLGGFWWFQRERRDEPPFRLYTGRRGRGKSLIMTRDLQRELARGTLVFSNFPVADPLSRTQAVTFESIDGLMFAIVRACLDRSPRIVVAFDEAQNHFDSRDWERFPVWLRTFLAESRHYHVGVLAATQSMSQVEKRFRLLCDEVFRVEPVFESLKHKVALFRLQHLEEARNSADDDERQVGRARMTWVVGRAFAGYSTVGLPIAETVSSADRDTMAELLEQLRDSVRDTPLADCDAA